MYEPENTPDKLLRVWTRVGSVGWVDPSDEPQIRQAKAEQIKPGGVDQLLTLTTAGGATWCIPVSDVVDWIESTRAERARDHAIVTLAERDYAEDRRQAWPDAPPE